jgi:hypothetical protein
MNNTNFPLIFQIKELPDLNSHKYTSIYGQGVRSKVLNNQTKFLLLLTEICKICNLIFSLRYLYLPNQELDQRLKIFLIVSQSDQQSSNNLLNNNQQKIITGFLSQFYQLVSLTSEDKTEYYHSFSHLEELECIGEAIKYEEIINSYDQNHFYLAPLPWESDESNDMSVVCEAITSFDSPSLLEITLQPYTDDQQRQKLINSINSTINQLKQLSNPGRQLGQQEEKSQEDAIARIFQKIYELTNLYRLASFDEISGLFRIVVPGNAPIKGIKQENSIAIENKAESLDFGGHEINSEETIIRFNLKQFNKHAFICGVPGSGKTSTSFNLLTQLYLKDIPFLVFESAKTEYRSLLELNPNPSSFDDFDEAQISKLTSLTKNLRIYTLGNEQISPFRFNPFEVSDLIPFYEHIGNLEASFRGALPLFGPLPALLSEALEKIYYDLDWTGNEIGTPEGKKIPTMRDLYAKISDLLESKDYVGEVKSNIKTALEDRQDIGGSMLLNKSQMEEIARLNPGQSFVYMEGWYRPALINIPLKNSAKVRFQLENSPTDDKLFNLIKDKPWYPKQTGKQESLREYSQALIDDLYNLRDKLFSKLADYLNIKKNSSLQRPETKGVIVLSDFSIEKLFGFHLTPKGEELTDSKWINLKSEMLTQIQNVEKKWQKPQNNNQILTFQRDSKNLEYPYIEQAIQQLSKSLNELVSKNMNTNKAD